MPTVTETETTAFAHCPTKLCLGGNQEEVKAVKVLTERSYREMGGDAPGTEVSWETFRFADEAERPCPYCGKSRELSDQERITYPNLSGQDPQGLLGVPKFDPRKQAELRAASVTDEERSQWEAQVQELREQVEALAAAQKEQSE